MISRVVAAILIVALAAALLVAAWPQLFGMHQLPLVAHVVSLRALGALAAASLILLLLVFSLFSRSFRRLAASLSVLLLGFILVNAAVLATRGLQLEAA